MSEKIPDDLTALAGSRICHDLISPLGAIANGLELLQMTGLKNSPELSLISDSIESANARVRFFRIAYGNADAAQIVKGNEIRSVLKAMYHTTRLDIVWDMADMPRIECKLALLTLQCLETALPYGGQIEIIEKDGKLFFSAKAPRVVLEEKLWERLTQPVEMAALRPAQVQFGLLAEMVQKLRRRVAVALDPMEISVTL